MYRLKKAVMEEEWLSAAQLLSRVAKYLQAVGCPLWLDHQVSVQGLTSTYQLDELHFFVSDQEEILGVVFLQTEDPYFWPELTAGDTLFVHKLAIDPVHKKKGYGSTALQLIAQEARARHLCWVRLDCDDREPLHRFYKNNGFQLVDTKIMQEFRVARYELALGE